MLPPFVGLAVNVTGVPLQKINPGFAVMATTGATLVMVVACMVSVTIDGDAQPKAEVMVTLIMSPLMIPAIENVSLFTPPLIPFRFH